MWFVMWSQISGLFGPFINSLSLWCGWLLSKCYNSSFDKIHFVWKFSDLQLKFYCRLNWSQVFLVEFRFSLFQHVIFITLTTTILVQEEVGRGEDGSDETVSLLEPNSSFGEISILCNIPQPYTVRVCELCRLLRLDKQSFMNILEIYFNDGRKIYNNLLKVIYFC